MPEVNLSNHTPGTVVLQPPETPEERAHRLAQDAKNAALTRHMLYGAAGLAAVSVIAAFLGPVETRPFAANTWWTLVGAGVGYALSRKDR